MPEARAAAMPAWIAALSATLLMQTVSSFMSQILPVVAPLMTQELGLRPERVGNFASLNTLGAILFLALGGPLLLRFGPVRLLQAGAALSAAALLLATLGVLPLLLASSLLLGIGYGPTGPAGSRILQATAPPRHRVLIFSVKQAGAPLGGAVAGLVAAPVATAYGWPSAFLLGIALALLAALAIQPMRASLDAERDPTRPWLGPPGAVLRAPFAALRLHPDLPRLTLLAFAFAVVQGSLFSFTVTWLVEAQGLALTVAGSAFAVMQAAGVGGRLLLGWLADRTGNAARNLAVQGVAAAILASAFVLLAPGAPFWALALLGALTGLTAASWNGIFLAEVARLSPPDRLGEATAGATLFCFLGYLTAPSAVSLAVTLTGSWTLPFLGAAAVLGCVALATGLRLATAAGQPPPAG